MTGTLRLRTLLLVLLAIAAWASSVGAGAASAFRKIHHPDPIKAFAKYKSPRTARMSTLGTFAPDWPCDPAYEDRPPAISSNAPQVKVIYAYPTDVGADNFPADSNLIQRDAKAVRDRLANEPGSSKTVRFDTGGTGAACTDPAHYLDIQKVQLSSSASTYNDSSSTFVALTNELRQDLPVPAPGARVNYIVYANQIEADGASGEADVALDDSHDPLNAVNQGRDGYGRLFAIVYGDPAGGPNFNGIADTTIADSVRQATFLHELSHNLGAVQDSAPHTSHAAHCLDEQDIMCYDDSGPGSPTLVCSAPTSLPFDEFYDCNRDDYYNPDPTPGSYLAQKWNTYDSVFLCNVNVCDSTLTPPPAITLGTTHVNGRLAITATPASGSITHYEWDIDGDGIYDADTGTTPSITPDFTFAAGRQVKVRASKADGTFAFDSADVTPTVPSPHFTVSGPLQVGQPLQLDGTSTEDPDGLITRFVWDLDGDNAYETDTGLGRTATTSFATPGTRTLGLAVESQVGFSFSRTQPFTIAPATTATVLPTATKTSMAVRVIKVKLGKLLKGGVPLIITCTAPCSARFTLSVNAKTARKLHLKGKKGKPVVIGRATGGFAAGTIKPKVTLTAAAKRALKRARTLSAALAGSLKQGSAPALKVSQPLTFKR